jgi:fructose-bisphosphate aldolase class II
MLKSFLQKRNMPGLLDIVKPGVLTGDDVTKVYKYAQEHGFAIPAVNVTSSSSINCVLQAARDLGNPVIIQFSQGGSAFYAGKGLSNKGEAASIAGAIAGAYHVRLLAKHYGIPVILHSDHCAKKLLPWFDGMLDADEAHFKQHGEPLFSSHMLDLSEEPMDENIAISKKYFERMAPLGLTLELELGITGGEEDGVDNTGVDNSSLYSQPDDIWKAYSELAPVSDRFTIAAAFGNVHGVYKAGNVKLHPELLGNFQKHVKAQLGAAAREKPVLFVFHGGSGSTPEEIHEAVSNGVVKMNVDTDMQWAYWDGIRKFEKENHDYLQGQLGNPKGPDAPNKKFYDPRVWLRKAEESMGERVKQAFRDLNCVGVLTGAAEAKSAL